MKSNYDIIRNVRWRAIDRVKAANGVSSHVAAGEKVIRSVANNVGEIPHFIRESIFHNITGGW